MTIMKLKKISKIISFLNFKPTGLLSTIFFLTFLIFLSLNAQALEPSRSIRQYAHDFWTSDDGLPQNYIGAITQTDDGYLWLATQQGLVRFNGTSFRVFDQWNTPEIKAIAIQALYKSQNGTLWIGTRGGGLTRLKDGKFKTYTSRDGLSSDFISSLCEDKKGNLWIGTEDGNLSIMKDGKFFTVNSKSDFSIINYINRDNKGNMWIATNKGLAKYSEGELLLYSTADGISGNRVKTVYEDSSGNLWIGTEGEGLNRFRDGKFEHFTTRTGLCNDVVISVFEDRAGYLWIGTRGGLTRFKEGKFESFTTKDGLSSNSLTSLYEDHEGSLWIGTHNGLNRLKDSKVVTYNTENGLPNDFVWSIFEDSKQNIWIGTHGSGLVKLKNGKIESFSVKDGLPSEVVRPVFEDKEGSLWIGTLAGLARMKNGKFTVYTVKDGLSNELIRSIFEDSKGTLWVGTDDGLNWYRDGKFGVFDLGGELERLVVYSIYEDRKGFLWIATYSGVIRIKDKSYQRFSSKDGLSHDRVFSILQDSLGSMWFGTNGGGLTRLKNGKFSKFMKNDGIPDNVIYQILEDKRQNLWMSSNRGIFSIKIKQLNDFAEGRINTLKPEIYGKAEGMKSLECNGGSQSAGCFTKDGKVWFPTLNGAVMINPELREKNEIRPPVKIEKVIVDDRAVPHDSRVILSPGARKFEFHYAALTYLAPEKVRFKFKLENFERDWVDAGSRREAYYTNVPPGSYRFRVIACNNDGLWNNTGASFEFYLKHYFYQTWWFYLMCGLGIAFSGVEIYRLRVRQLRKHKKELEKRVKERTAELKAANEDLQQEITERKLAEEALQTEKVYLDQLFESAQEAIVMTDNDGRVLRMNSEFTRLFGYKYDEAVGRPIDDLVASKELRDEAMSNTKNLGNGERIAFESIRQNKDGTLINVLGIGAPIIVGNKQVAVYCIYRDITERKRAEEDAYRRAAQAALIYEVGQRVSSELELNVLLSESVTAVQETFNYYGVMLMLLNKEGKRLKLQSIAGGYTNIFPKDLWIAVGEGMIGYVAATGKAQVSGDISKNLNYVRKAIEVTKSELAVPIKKGQKVIGVLDIQSDEFDAFDETDVAAMEILSTQISTAIDNARLYEQAQREITERKRAEEEIEKRQQYLESVLHDAPDAIVTVDSSHHIIEWNLGAEKIFGYTRNEALGKNLDDIVTAPDVIEEAKALTKKSLSGERVPPLETVRYGKNGTPVNVIVAGSPLKIGDKLHGVVVVYTDITERKVIEKQLEDFAYVVSHDLKAPLRAINQLAAWISQDHAGAFDKGGKEQMDLLVGRVKRMDNLIDGILQYSRAGRIKGSEKEVDLNNVVKEVIDTLAPPKNIHVTIEDKLPVILAETVRIEQVFQNLISNAIKYMDKPKGEIRVGYVDEGNNWKFSIADNGPGIEEKYYDKIFQIFQTLESRDKRESTGVGLALVKKIVELYGGKIWVESKTGEGSTFFFTVRKIK